MKWRKIIKALLIGPLVLTEYGAFVIYVSRSFSHRIDYDKYPNIPIILEFLIIHAVLCLVVAVATGFIIHKKTTVDTLEVFLWACFCAFCSLPFSLLLVFMAGILLMAAPNKWIDTSIYEIVVNIMLIVAYILGIILPSAHSIRMAKIAQKGSVKEPLQQP